MTTNPWKTLSSREVYRNPWLRLREDEVLRPDGQPGIYSVLELPASVGVVVLDDNDAVLLVGQWRYAHNKFSLEIPTGGSEQNEPLEEAAKRELEEEAGVVAEQWMPLGSIDNCNGATTDVAHIYVARTISFTEKRPDPTEQISIKWIPFHTSVEMVFSGEITESCSVAALLKVHAMRIQGAL